MVGLLLSVLAGLGLGAEVPVPSDSTPAAVQLRRALERYREVADWGGWPTLPAGPGLRPDQREARVPLLRRRLRIEGFHGFTTPADSQWYDEALAAAVRKFQELHGLNPDGVVGPGTLRALNVSARVRVAQLAANLPRVQRFTPGSRYVLVNSAAFRLQVVEGDRIVLQLRVIVGRPDWQTPVVSTMLTAAVFRPLWRVPQSIAAEEVIPRVRRDPGYLRRIGMRVLRDPAGDRFVQEPGPQNPLGNVKLVLHTPYGVFLHDTPGQHLFARERRSLSHGCVRVEHIDRLVSYLLPEWPADSITAAMAAGRDRQVAVSRPIPVHLVYWTAWVEPDGQVAFREDIYRRDRR